MSENEEVFEEGDPYVLVECNPHIRVVCNDGVKSDTIKLDLSYLTSGKYYYVDMLELNDGIVEYYRLVRDDMGSKDWYNSEYFDLDKEYDRNIKLAKLLG